MGNRVLLLLSAVCVCFCLVPSVANASILYVTPDGEGDGSAMTLAGALGQIAEGNETSQAQIDTAIASFLGGSIEIYKQNVGDAMDTGSAAGSYETSFFNDPDDPAEFTISLSDGATAVSGITHVLVKDGNQTPAWYLYSITWDGSMDMDLIGFDFWPSQGAVSHVALYAGEDPGEGVIPEPASVVVWSGLTATIAMVAYRRRRR